MFVRAQTRVKKELPGFFRFDGKRPLTERAISPNFGCDSNPLRSYSSIIPAVSAKRDAGSSKQN
jgi:hypothetical protein